MHVKSQSIPQAMWRAFQIENTSIKWLEVEIKSFEAGTNCMMMAASEDQHTVLLGHSAPQCIIQKSFRNASEERLTGAAYNIYDLRLYIDARIIVCMVYINYGACMHHQQLKCNLVVIQNRTCYIDDLGEYPVQSRMNWNCVSTASGLFKQPATKVSFAQKNKKCQPAVEFNVIHI